MRHNWKIIGSFLGLLLAINGLFMLLCLPFSLYFNEGDWVALLASGLLTLGVGAALWTLKSKAKSKELKKRDGYLIVTLGWLAMSLFGCLPFVLSGAIPNLTDAFFETMSGFTTTGATILVDIEGVHKGLLFWRSMTQWIGGMGIIVLTVAILPILGIGGMQLFVAEAPGIAPDKLKPRIQATAKRLWLVYAGLTVIECVLLMLGGMGFYDAINHSLTTMATGGFSTKNASVDHFTSPYIQYVITVFMFLAGTSFTLNYFMFKGKFSKFWTNEEFRYYFLSTLIFTLITAVTVYFVTDDGIEKSFRDAVFQVVSIITTTGYGTSDYTTWTPFITMLFFIMMFVGGSAGSTAGGIKIVRHVILFKNSALELKRQLHPSAVMPVRFNNKAVSQQITFNVLAFFIIFISIFAFSSLVISMMGLNFETAVSAVATCIGNIGPGLDSVGPKANFSHLPGAAKWLLSFLMLLGRLELFTVLMLITPYYWKKT
ncbi:TrkH family potassium uptake protein [Flammeovirgaceae bacterium SG7u.111]|nr:TrkH family potassium uptake protein [Flammeovirgaceae bacterium SG7u.132]WPO35884.1 TrkH family potassium uptake protein [Flammeovirgaceae bacterium SG7u.111]